MGDSTDDGASTELLVIFFTISWFGGSPKSAQNMFELISDNALLSFILSINIMFRAITLIRMEAWSCWLLSRRFKFF